MSKLLAPFCWVERLREASARKDDLDICMLTAWTEHPSIPPSRKLRIAKKEVPVIHSCPVNQRIFGNLPPYLRKKHTLIYNVEIHLRNIADFRPRTPSTSSDSLSDDGDSGPDDNPDCHYGSRQGHAGPRFFTIPRRDSGTAVHGGAASNGNYGATTRPSGPQGATPTLTQAVHGACSNNDGLTCGGLPGCASSLLCG